jgi:purine-binding chemotaxis protein CheW
MDDKHDRRQLVVFTLGTDQYALPIAYVHEIIRYTEPRSIVSPVAGIRGVISLRGKIVPVYDLAARLGVTFGTHDAKRVVIVESGETLVGIVVDEVDEVVSVENEQVEPAPSADSTVIEAIAKLGGRLVLLLTPGAILRDLEAA